MPQKRSNAKNDSRPSERLIDDMKAEIDAVIERARKKPLRRSDDSMAFLKAAEIADKVRGLAESTRDAALTHGSRLAQAELKQAVDRVAQE